MPTSCAPRDKACAVRKGPGGGSKADEPSSPAFYMILVRRPSTARHKHQPTAPPNHLAPVLSQAAGALLSSSTSCRARTLSHGKLPEARAALQLNTAKHGVHEEHKSSRLRAAQGYCSGLQAARLAAGTARTGPVDGVVCRVRVCSRASPVGFRPSTHLRGPTRHVRASASRVSRRPIQK